MNFIERLNGPPIGMYCYDIAPYDNRTFIQVKLKLLVVLIKIIDSILFDRNSFSLLKLHFS